MRSPLALVLSTVAMLAAYIFYARIAARRDRARGVATPRRLADGGTKSWRSALTTMAVVAGLLATVVIAQRFTESRHAAAKEHLSELLDTAAAALSCPRDGLTSVPEAPTRVRVAGCGRTLTFRWGSFRRPPEPKHWAVVDPNCKVDYFVFKFNCY